MVRPSFLRPSYHLFLNDLTHPRRIRRAAASISLPIGLFAVLVGMGLRQLKLGEI